MNNPKDLKFVKYDALWGNIHLSEESTIIIKCKAFQRLKMLKQLGSMQMTNIFSGAVGNRYDHSIGVAYLANYVMNVLYKKGFVQKREILLVELAALCHDIGHGFMSHMFDTLAKNNNKIEHEARSQIIFEHLIVTFRKKNKINLTNEEIKIVQYFIHPNSQLIARNQEAMKFTKGIEQIVSNIKCEIDVDKMDYILRDSIYLGYGHTHKNELLNIKGILERSIIEGDNWCFNFEDKASLIKLLSQRYTLYYDYYLHPESIAINDKLIKIFEKANTIYNFIKCANLEFKKDISEFIKLTDDYIIELLLNRTEENPCNLSVTDSLLLEIKDQLQQILNGVNVPYDINIIRKKQNLILSNDKSSPHIAINKIIFYDSEDKGIGDTSILITDVSSRECKVSSELEKNLGKDIKNIILEFTAESID